MSKQRKIWPLRKALFIILVSTFLVSGSATLAIFYYKKTIAEKVIDHKYNIRNIIQTGTQKEALRTEYLAELLCLSENKPTNIYSFDVSEAKLKLLNSPVIKEAYVKTLLPDTVYIDYTVYTPVAKLYDITNTAIDEEGITFPISPFFTPKKLPEIFFGETILQTEKVTLALELLDLMKVCWVDVSQAYSENCGKRQIVVILEEEEGLKRSLRLTTKNYAQELKRYIALRKYLKPQQQIIDFRVSDIALVHN